MKTLLTLLLVSLSFLNTDASNEHTSISEPDTTYCRVQFYELYCEKTETWNGEDFIYIKVSIDGDREFRFNGDDIKISKGETNSLRGGSIITLGNNARVSLYDHDRWDSDDFLGSDNINCGGDGVLVFNKDGASYRLRYRFV